MGNRKSSISFFVLLVIGASLLAFAARFAYAFAQTQSANRDVDLSNADVAAIVQIAKDFSDANKAEDVKRIAGFYSPDVIYMYQGMPNHVGREVIAEMYQDFFSKYTAQVVVHVDEVKVCGDMAFDRATFTVTGTPKLGGEGLVSKGRVLEILRKEGGKWMSLRVMVNTEE